MRIKFHLDSAELMSCASGSQPEALGAIISTHLSMCPHCRNELKVHSLIGETLFNSLPGIPLVSVKSSQVPKQLNNQGSVNPQSQKLHDVLCKIYSGHSHKINWRTIDNGIADFSIPLLNKSAGTLLLIKCDPNISLPHLEQSGTQIVMVLEGALRDNDGEKNKGDVIHLSPDHPYSLTASKLHGCICLVGSETTVNLQNVFH